MKGYVTPTQNQLLDYTALFLEVFSIHGQEFDVFMCQGIPHTADITNNTLFGLDMTAT